MKQSKEFHFTHKRSQTAEMSAWIMIPMKLCSVPTPKLEIVLPTHKKPILFPQERSIMGEDLRLHHESVTVYCDEYAVKILMKLIVIDNSDRVKLVVSTHSAELDKLNFVFLR